MTKFFTHTFMLALCLAPSALALQHLGSLYTSEWHMMEDIIITQPGEQSKSWKGILCTLGAAAAGVKLTHMASEKILTFGGWDDADQMRPNFRRGKGSVALLGGGLIGLTAFQILSQYHEMNALKNFIQKWQTFKQYTPKEFQRMFNELAERQNIQAISDQELTQVLRAVKQSIHNKFPEKYSPKAQSFFDSRHFVAQAQIEAGNVLRGVADIWRAATGR